MQYDMRKCESCPTEFLSNGQDTTLCWQCRRDRGLPLRFGEPEGNAYGAGDGHATEENDVKT